MTVPDLHHKLTDLGSTTLGLTSINKMAQDRVTRKWEIFQGRNRFCCNGRLMTAPSSGVFYLTIFLISGTSLLFFIFDCPYLAVNVTVAIPILGTMLFLFNISSLLRTSLTDPGIIPRATSEEASYVEKQIEVTNSANSPTYRPPPRTKEVLVKGQTIKLKYCFTCKIFRPPRASHCSICDNCVERFDHHCPWVGNCVGRRNYRYFYMFIVSLAFLAVFIFACAVAHLILITKEDRQFLDAVKESPPSVIVAVVCFFSVWSIVGLAGFHTYLTTSNQTTNEDIKGSFTSKRGQESFNPYSRGNVCLNCFHILCGPVAPSLIDRRGLVTDCYRSEVSRPVMSEPNLAIKHYGINSETNGPSHITMNSSDMPGIYRQTTETTESNAGSITQLVTSEHPIAIAPALQRLSEDSSSHYKSQPSLNHSPVYNNLMPQTLSRSHSYADNLNSNPHLESNLTNSKSILVQQHSSSPETKETSLNAQDLDLDPVLIRESHILANINSSISSEKHANNIKLQVLKLDNDMTLQDKENSLLSASRLRLLQDTTMIESALDLDSLEDSSLGTNSQAGLMKIVV